jgi:Di-haem cytochrome c peroxidase
MLMSRAGPACAWVLACLPSLGIGAIPGSGSLLPLGTDLGDAQFDRPREVFRSETAGGHKSYMVVLGDVAFSSPKVLGGVARQSGISCSTCHVNGAANSQFYIPGLSTRHGNFDTTSSVFNPKTDDSVLDPLTIPSLRGAHLLAPYGHDGRTLSLRDFIRNVVVNEFSGPEPSAEVLDALVLYVQDIDFVPNQRLGAGGRLTGSITKAERHGEKLFYKPFPHDRALSCAGCHQPTEAFVDHRQHDVGSGGLFKTPTLRNANFNAPYFHDGRYASYEQVVAHFNQWFSLGLSARDQADLTAYLKAIGDGDRATTPDDVSTRVKECTDFATALDTALPQHDAVAAALVLDTLDRELRELTEKFPEPKDTSVSGGFEQRAKARVALKGLVLSLREIAVAVREGRFDEATAGLALYREKMTATIAAMERARQWSLFDRQLHDAHFAAVSQLYEVGTAAAK